MKRMRWKKGILCLLTLFLILTVGIPTALAEGASTEILSYGLQVLAAKTDVAISMPRGNDVTFSQDVFARGLNLSSVQSITVRSLPATTDGELLMGSTRVAIGQTISAANLPYLTFSASHEDVTHTSFSFTANGVPLTHLCNIYLLSESNYTPTVSMASELSLNVSTYKGLSAHGTLSAYDPDGDEVVFEIVSYPTHGSLKVINNAEGTYIYEPYAGYVGADSFTYVARDRYGNYSTAATVSLSVQLSATAVTYADMEHSSAYSAALAMTENGIMSGKQVGSLYYFYPNDGVSRAEFLVMAMNALGMTEVPACEDTGFADDADIEPTMKGYVAAAYSLGYINGSLADGELCFLPNEEITRAQAAVMLSAMMGLEDATVIPTFADASEIPAWAKDAIYSLHAVGIMQSDEGAISPTDTLTRAQAAKMLAGVMAYAR